MKECDLLQSKSIQTLVLIYCDLLKEGEMTLLCPRYALVNIVMGDIADIEKKKSKGLSTLLLGAKPNQMVQVGAEHT